MDNYVLAPDEVVLYHGELKSKEGSKAKVEVMLTNLFLAFICKTKKIFKEEINVEAYPMDTIKVYNENPQIIRKNAKVEIYFKDSEHFFEFNDVKEAKKFVNQALALATGRNKFFRAVDKTKKVINDIDTEFGVDTVGTVKNIANVATKSNKVAGAVKKVIGLTVKKEKTKETVSVTNGVITRKETKTLPAPTISPNDQIEAIKGLKELLDQNIISQEEFEKKKKEVLGV